MRVAWLGPPPWAASGYGVQTRLFTRWLAGRGHEVAVLAYAGCHRPEVYEGVQILPAGMRPYGNGVFPHLVREWRADALVLMCDLWPVEPGQLARVDCPVYPWVPVDADPLGVMDKAWLESAKGDVRLVAMSQFGARVLEEGGWPVAAVIPHSARPEMGTADGAGWRRDNGLSADQFLFVKVGVNDDKLDRKAFAATLLAFQRHARKHRDSWLYVHTEAQHPSGINLAYMCQQLGLTGRVRFPEEWRRTADLYGDGWMAGMHAAADCFAGASAAEGFGIGAIESLACGRPVILTRGSAMTELAGPAYSRLVGGEPKWAHHHHSWWVSPSVTELAAAMDSMHGQARQMRPAALRAAGRWQLDVVAPLWEKLLTGGL